VILISASVGQIDLDADCVLYGEIAYVGWDVLVFDGMSLGPRAVWMLGASLIINVLVISLFYKQLKLCAFDPEMARSLGIRTGVYHYLLMTMTALTTVAAFESVGAILVVAMLVVPASTAFLLTQRLSSMLFLSAVVGCLSAVLGYAIALSSDTSISGAMSVAAGILFTLAFLFSPHHGVLIKRFRGIDTSVEAGLDS
jgi:manganese/zinc/iron transport system permease protein